MKKLLIVFFLTTSLIALEEDEPYEPNWHEPLIPWDIEVVCAELFEHHEIEEPQR